MYAWYTYTNTYTYKYTHTYILEQNPPWLVNLYNFFFQKNNGTTNPFYIKLRNKRKYFCC